MPKGCNAWSCKVEGIDGIEHLNVVCARNEDLANIRCEEIRPTSQALVRNEATKREKSDETPSVRRTPGCILAGKSKYMISFSSSML